MKRKLVIVVGLVFLLVQTLTAENASADTQTYGHEDINWTWSTYAWVGYPPCVTESIEIQYKLTLGPHSKVRARWEHDTFGPAAGVEYRNDRDTDFVVNVHPSYVTSAKASIVNIYAAELAYNIFNPDITNFPGKFKVSDIVVTVQYEPGPCTTPLPPGDPGTPPPMATPYGGPTPTLQNPTPNPAVPTPNPTPTPTATPPPGEVCIMPMPSGVYGPPGPVDCDEPGAVPLVSPSPSPTTPPGGGICASFPSQGTNSAAFGAVEDTSPSYAFQDDDVWFVETCVRTASMTTGTFCDGSAGDTVQYVDLGYGQAGNGGGSMFDAGAMRMGDTSPYSCAGWVDGGGGWRFRDFTVNISSTVTPDQPTQLAPSQATFFCGPWGYAGSGGATVYCAGRALQLEDGDPDGDTYPNEQEYSAGTDPNDPDDHPSGPANGAPDDDGDGYTNEEELDEGTDPDDPDSYPGSEEEPEPTDQPCVFGPGACGPGQMPDGMPSDAGNIQSEQGLGTVAVGCEPTYPKPGQVAMVDTTQAPPPPDVVGIPIVEQLFWIGSWLGEVPDMVRNFGNSSINTVIDLVFPSDCFPLIFEGFIERVKLLVPFSWLVEASDVITAALEDVGDEGIPQELTFMGRTIPVGSSFDMVESMLSPFRVVFVALLYLRFAMFLFAEALAFAGRRNEPQQQTLWGL